MKIIFFGSSDFGIACLDYLKENHPLAAIITNPDKPKGRHLKMKPTPIKQWAEEKNIRLFQPSDLLEPFFIKAIKGLNPDIIILISFGRIIPKEILDIPRLGSFNIHPSILPAYRGAAPMEWTLINGEKKTGITMIKMEQGIDKGNIIIQKEIPIEERDNYYTLKEKLMKKSYEVLNESMEKISSGFTGFPQKGMVSYAPRLTKKDGHIKWEKDAYTIHNLVRGIVNWPGAFSYLVFPKGKKTLKIKETEIEKHDGVYGVPGNFIYLTHSIKVACGKGIIKIKKVQMEGKKEIDAEEFLHGYLKYLKSSVLQ